jgi:hypothetical protein
MQVVLRHNCKRARQLAPSINDVCQAAHTIGRLARYISISVACVLMLSDTCSVVVMFAIEKQDYLHQDRGFH